ncbi:MAG: cytochrome c oxidase subunit 3 [Methanobacteriota archaeon]
MEHAKDAGHGAGSAAHHGSYWPFVAGFGAAIGYAGLVMDLRILGLGLVIFAAGALGWLRDDLRSTSRADYGTVVARPDVVRVSSRKLATWLFLATEIMFFSAIIGVSWSLRVRSADWAIPGVDSPLNILLTGFNTFILICSSLTMVEALAAAERGNQRQLRLFLAATLALGITFLGIQGFEYVKLFFTEGLTFTSAPGPINDLYGSTFYIQTGVHGSHVFAGVLAMAYTTIKAFRGGFTKENHEAVELVGLYWHFVDVVWIFLFTIVYLI